MPRPGSLGKSLLRMAFGPGRLSEYYYYYYNPRIPNGTEDECTQALPHGLKHRNVQRPLIPSLRQISISILTSRHVDLAS